MKPIKTLLKLVAAGMTLTTAQAALIYQTAGHNPTPSNWNASGIWGSPTASPVAGNDYQTVPNADRLAANNPYGTSFTVGSTAWSYYAMVRDHGNTSLPTTNSTFAGDHLILGEGTRFLSKNRNTITTAEFILQSGSHMFHSPGGVAADGAGTATWAGSISTSGNTAIGLETSNNTSTTTLNIIAPISGSGTLTLTGRGNQTASLNLNGNISGFTGTFLLSSANDKTASPLTFSIAESATLATLQLLWESPFFAYNLDDNDVTFASLILGEDNVLAPDTYDADALNALTGNTGIFTGTGTITVIPEPGTTALAAVAALAAFTRRRRHTA